MNRRVSSYRKKVLLSPGWMELRLLPAAQAVEGRARAAALQDRMTACSKKDALALAHNACLAAMSLYRDGERAFSNGMEAFESLTLEDLATVTLEYDSLQRKGGERLEKLLSSAEAETSDEWGWNESFQRQAAEFCRARGQNRGLERRD